MGGADPLRSSLTLGLSYSSTKELNYSPGYDDVDLTYVEHVPYPRYSFAFIHVKEAPLSLWFILNTYSWDAVLNMHDSASITQRSFFQANQAASQGLVSNLLINANERPLLSVVFTFGSTPCHPQIIYMGLTFDVQTWFREEGGWG